MNSEFWINFLEKLLSQSTLCLFSPKLFQEIFVGAHTLKPSCKFSGASGIRNTMMYTQLWISKKMTMSQELLTLKLNLPINWSWLQVCMWLRRVQSFQKTQVIPSSQNGRGLSVAGGEGFEPSTPNLGGWCSIRTELLAQISVQHLCKLVGCNNSNVQVSEQIKNNFLE